MLEGERSTAADGSERDAGISYSHRKTVAGGGEDEESVAAEARPIRPFEAEVEYGDCSWDGSTWIFWFWSAGTVKNNILEALISSLRLKQFGMRILIIMPIFQIVYVQNG